MRAALLAAALLVGCSSTRTPATDALADAITAYEETEGGELVALPSSGIAEVDVNSRLVLKMNTPAIAQSAPPEVDREEVERLTHELAQLDQLLVQLARMLQSLERLRATEEPTRVQLESHGKLELAFIEALDSYLRETRQDPAAADQALSEPGYAGLQRYLEQARRDHEQLVRAIDTRRWRVRASLRSGQRALPVHVTNYDNLEVGELDIRNKLVPAMDGAVQREMEQARKLAATVESLDGFTKLIEEQARARATALVQRLEDTASQLRGRVQKLQSVQSTAGAARTLIAAVRSLGEQGEASAEACKDAAQRIRAVAGGPSAAVVATALDAARGCATKLRALGKTARETVDAARALADRTALEALVSQVSAEAAAMVDLDEPLAGVLQALGFAKKPLATPAWASSGAFSDRRMADLIDGRVDLTRTDRQIGDHVTFQGLLLKKPGDTVLMEGPPRDLEVVQNGLQLQVSGALLFVSPFDVASNEDDFRALPALSGAFHYRCRREGGEPTPDGLCAVWNFFSPGLGASIVTITLGEVTDGASDNVGTPHPSPAVVGRLFGDVLQGGVGYDFISSRSYWFVGLGIQTLTDLGFTSNL